MAQHFLTDGIVKELLPANGVKFTLEELQGAVEGHIEAVYFSDGRVMFVNEEGRLEGLPINDKATSTCAADPGAEQFLWAGDAPIVGNALLLTIEETEAGNEEA